MIFPGGHPFSRNRTGAFGQMQSLVNGLLAESTTFSCSPVNDGLLKWRRLMLLLSAVVGARIDVFQCDRSLQGCRHSKKYTMLKKTLHNRVMICWVNINQY